MKPADQLVIGNFVSRPNRFLANVLVDGQNVLAHVPNTSRLSELTISGARVAVSYHPDAGRKTKYSLRMIEKAGEWFSIDSQLPNDLVEEALKTNVIETIRDARIIEREKTFGDSRFDFRIEDSHGSMLYLEVKGVTLEVGGVGHFPGAPTLRGVKHLKELSEVVASGMRGAVIFVLQFNGAVAMRPNWDLDPLFAKTLVEVSSKGVEILAYACDVTLDEVTVVRQVPVILDDYR